MNIGLLAHDLKSDFRIKAKENIFYQDNFNKKLLLKTGKELVRIDKAIKFLENEKV